MNGTTFYSRGNPVMKRLTAEVQARSQARAMIERVFENRPPEQPPRTGLLDNGEILAFSIRSPNEVISVRHSHEGNCHRLPDLYELRTLKFEFSIRIFFSVERSGR